MVYQTSTIDDESCKFYTNLDQAYFLLTCPHLDANEDLIILDFFNSTNSMLGDGFVEVVNHKCRAANPNLRPRLHGSEQIFARTNFVSGPPVYMEPCKFCCSGVYMDPCKV